MKNLAIERIKTIDEIVSFIKPYKKSNALVIIDVDNTLIKPAGLVGTSVWCNYEKTKRMNQGLSYDEAFDQILAFCKSIDHVMNYSFCELTTSNCIKIIQEYFPHVIGMTGRTFAQAEFTCNLLKKIDICFEEPHFLTHVSEKALEGIWFCEGINKAIILQHLLQKSNVIPDIIIVIDDMISYLDGIEQMLKMHYPQIDFIGIHYTYAEDNQDAFDACKSEIELQQIINKAQLHEK